MPLYLSGRDLMTLSDSRGLVNRCVDRRDSDNLPAQRVSVKSNHVAGMIAERLKPVIGRERYFPEARFHDASGDANMI